MSQDGLHRIIYISTATSPMSKPELNALLKQSRVKNRFLNITGYMIYFEGTILQVLEGSETSVEYIYNTILMDARHHNSVELFSESIEERLFDDWQMGFQKIEPDQIKSIKTVEDLFTDQLSGAHLNKLCSKSNQLFETFLKAARLNNFQLIKTACFN